MPRIKITNSVSCDGHFDYRAGQIAEVSRHWANLLVAKGVAERIPQPVPRKTQRKRRRSE
jgi:hypothetical protein